MTAPVNPSWDDTVLPFQLEHSNIRGRVARLDGVLNAVLEQHDYPPMIEALIAEMTVLTALIGQTIKLRWKLSLQVRGDGPIPTIATDYYGPADDGQPAKIRAYASYNAETLNQAATPFSQLGKGYFAILIDQGPDMTPYQGITPISGSSLHECAQTYFAQSEQIPTRFSLSFGQSQAPGEDSSWRAGGIMLQHMPEASPLMDKGDGATGDEGLLAASDIVHGDDEDHWNRVNVLLDTVEELELIGPTVPPKDLLVRLFHEEAPRAFDVQEVRFGCTCSADRVKDSLSIYSAKDLVHMTNEDGKITADCQFCGAHYVLDPAEVGIDAADKD